jgi:hypothetical protein
MKKRILLVTGVLVLSLCACAKDKEGNVQETIDIFGQNDEIKEEEIVQSTTETEKQSESEEIEEEIVQSTLETEKQNEIEEISEAIETKESVAQEQIGYSNNVIDEKSQTIEGYQLTDGQEVPVNVTFKVVNTQRGDEAYNILAKDSDMVEVTDDMECIIITLEVTYNSGDAEELFMAENDASLQSAKLKFTLSNGDSNAEDVTMYLNDSIYDLSIPNGSSDRGSVAFIRKKGSNEPLYFSGFNSTISFIIEN